MKTEVTLPDLGEDTVEEVIVSGWLAKIGDTLSEGDDLLEVTTDKAAFCVPCPDNGTLAECAVGEGDVVNVGDVLCIMDT